MKVFHYTKGELWDEVMHGSYRTNYAPGLAQSPVAILFPDELRGVFALLESEPRAWKENKLFPHTWDYLLHDVGRVLLEIEVNEDSPDTLVLERAHADGYKFGRIPGVAIPSAFRHQTLAEAERAYLESKVPFSVYRELTSAQKYCLPEVLLVGDVPIKQVRVSLHQPRMDELLASGASRLMDKTLKQVPELAEWLRVRRAPELPESWEHKKERARVREQKP